MRAGEKKKKTSLVKSNEVIEGDTYSNVLLSP